MIWGKSIDFLASLLAVAVFATMGYGWYAHQTSRFVTHRHWVYAVDANPDGVVASASALYGSGLALFTIPIALFFSHLKVLSAQGREKVVLPLFLNLLLSGVISSFVVSAGF